MKRTLFLNAPSFDGFDGGAGARYQARREITSYWYPTWLAQAAALVPGSRLIDAPAHGLGTEHVLAAATAYELVVLHTSTPSLANDLRFARELKARNPAVEIGLVGAHVTVLPEESLTLAAGAVDFACRGEFDYTCVELAEGRPYRDIRGLSYRGDGDAAVVHTPDRPRVEDWDALPSVLPVYHRDLTIENYVIGYLRHPYVSLYTGRGCPGRCTFCLWPQTIGGHGYRAKSPAAVVRELEEGRALFPQAREWFFDDDTFTADPARAVEISQGLKRLGLTWSCNARANLDYDTLKALRHNGLRVLVVGFESGNADVLRHIRKGVSLDRSRQFMRDCRRLGIKVHGTFILGLPLETPESIEDTIRFAQEANPHTIQVSIAAPYPGTELYDEAVREGWLGADALVSDRGVQTCTLRYPGLDADAVEEAVERMYRRFYFRPGPIFRMLREMGSDRRMLVRRLREAREFFDYLGERKRIARDRHRDGPTSAPPPADAGVSR